jgi:hypothetical protein
MPSGPHLDGIPGATQTSATIRLFLATLPALLLLVQAVAASLGLTYTLDDSYISLSLARGIGHGHYGLNPGEFAAASSSILWPFLLVPLVSTGVAEYVPLVIDLVALAATLAWLDRWLRSWMPDAWALAATVGAGFLFNLYGLPLTGMEHSLQILLVVIIAVSVVERRFAWSFWISVVVLPLVRYEGLAISLPVLAWLLLGAGHRTRALMSSALVVALVVGFSLFLHAHGVGFLPSSVVVTDSFSSIDRLYTFDDVLPNIHTQPGFVILAVVAVALYAREGRLLEAALLIAVPTIGHLMLGQYGGFGRYHIYFAIWVTIFCLTAYARSPLAKSRPARLALFAVLAAGSTDTLLIALASPQASRNIGDQQGQMAAIVQNYLKEPVAVHDLGMVSFYGGQYVLDIAGLASYEALQQNRNPDTATWIAALMQRHGVEHAMIYDSFYPRRPANWIRVATLHLPPPCVMTGSSDSVAFYSTSPAAAARLARALEQYRAHSDRAATMLTFEAPEPSVETCNAFYDDPYASNLLVHTLVWSKRSVFGKQ